LRQAQISETCPKKGQSGNPAHKRIFKDVTSSHKPRWVK